MKNLVLSTRGCFQLLVYLSCNPLGVDEVIEGAQPSW